MKTTIATLQAKKGTEKIAAITAYDALFATLFDGHIDVILIGDSLNMSFGGKEDTLSASLDTMIYHAQAVCRGAKQSFLIADMPFGSYPDTQTAINNALKFYQQTSVDAIKLEGGKERAEMISHIVKEGIAVIGHIGLMPQFVRAEGGYKIKGKTQKEVQYLLQSAAALQEAGVSMIVLEGVTTALAAQITQSLEIPTIGIGSSKECDGQILVWSDMMGLFGRLKPKFVRQYLNGTALIQEALKNYIQDVKSGDFPSPKESY
ncbi:3-methyl-2-oxobutanoate hydroxymethyltransferase [Helicobacter sp. 12S02634-8]|uniref:3-methyl-2-oxobutanoate hydroxymethyltransferase n=1 Tax=Helicobacter sp. 12S02634-8 TaxID=1476199 RepID=UPI000BA58594|nr:3-methyl-2-oxobutanoate hydroxymethyltransferase [Helicobacter sp. 12S02634-8]PAF47532.1 3-methyl-2-oxobutanoate hydroxymethyltransferase [Helicobacter sp. 12S02634-8]